MRRGAPVVLGERVAGWRWTHGYVEDVAHAIGVAATRHVPGIYNVGEADPPTALERLRAIVERAEVVPDDRLPPDLVVPIANPVDLVFETSKIRRELGYRELVDPSTAYARTIQSIGS
jgi:nucleoside-diphosphate-sugar epimerase